jgi:structure-specific recognition protein 1
MSDQCTKGTNWGQVSIDDKNLFLKYNQNNIIKFPLKKVVNSNTQKNDIVL